jgi:hypothetical protein
MPLDIRSQAKRLDGGRIILQETGGSRLED